MTVRDSQRVVIYHAEEPGEVYLWLPVVRSCQLVGKLPSTSVEGTPEIDELLDRCGPVIQQAIVGVSRELGDFSHFKVDKAVAEATTIVTLIGEADWGSVREGIRVALERAFDVEEIDFRPWFGHFGGLADA